MAIVTKRGYSAGDEVDSKCNKCKLVLAHTIIAMNGDKVARVQCNTCRGPHAYRPPEGAKERTAARRRTTNKAPEEINAKTSASDFDTLIKGHDLSRAEKYSIRMQLKQNDAVNHPKFGIGLVTEIREGGKAHVAFRDGGRVLVYGR